MYKIISSDNIIIITAIIIKIIQITLVLLSFFYLLVLTI
jgi:hypothetical protein